MLIVSNVGRNQSDELSSQIRLLIREIIEHLFTHAAECI